MIELRHCLPAEQSSRQAPSGTLTLPFDRRRRSRQRARLDDGTIVALILPRGTLMRHGQLLTDDEGRHRIRIIAAVEPLSEVTADLPPMLARAAYHLGNRHVPLQIGDGWLRYRQDHVLDAMVAGLGLRVQAVQAAFDPEEGAYGASSHDH